MGMDNLMLYVATYDDAAAATEDYTALKAAEVADLEVVSSVVMHRDADGKISVDEVTKGVWPFMLAELIVLALLIAFPALVLEPLRWLC